jgi:hypothetical protein
MTKCKVGDIGRLHPEDAVAVAQAVDQLTARITTEMRK